MSSNATVRLPKSDGSVETFKLAPPADFVRPDRPSVRRVALAAAHVVADPLADNAAGRPAVVDWDATLAFRHHLWDLGLHVAEAMDTAQRGMGLDWDATRELIRRSTADAKTHAPRFGGIVPVACGAGTDQIPDPRAARLPDVLEAWREQVAFVEDCGGRVILMASRALAACATSPDDYLDVYGKIIAEARGPVILHWLGDMFDPQLAGYWGTPPADFGAAAETVVRLMREHATKIDGIKMSLLDASKEVMLRRMLPPGVKMYTGDDFNYPDLIAGEDEPFGEEEGTFSHALLGIFDPIAPAAAAALAALDAGDRPTYDRVMNPTVPLGRHLFAAPTFFYKTGVVFLAYLNGHQKHFRMVGGLESGRGTLHLAEALRLASTAGLLRDPDLAAARVKPVMALAGVE